MRSASSSSSSNSSSESATLLRGFLAALPAAGLAFGLVASSSVPERSDSTIAALRLARTLAEQRGGRKEEVRTVPLAQGGSRARRPHALARSHAPSGQPGARPRDFRRRPCRSSH